MDLNEFVKYSAILVPSCIAVITIIVDFNRNNRTTSLGVFLICLTCCATFFVIWNQYNSDKEADKEKELRNLSFTLTKEIKVLSSLNKELGERTKELLQINTKISEMILVLSQKNKSVVSEVQDLTKQSKKIIQKIEQTTSNTAAEDLKTGSLNFSTSFKDSDFFTVWYGSLSYMNTIAQFKRGLTLLSIGGKNIFQPNYKDNKMLINFKVHDLKGNIIAEIEDNNWRINQNFAAKFNYDEHGFEVVDNRGNVVLNLNIAKSNSIVIQGIFPVKEVQKVILIGREMIPVDIHITEERLDKITKEVEITQLFEYTGKNWLGKRRSKIPQ